MSDLSFFVAGIPCGQGSMRAFMVKGRPVLTSTTKRLKPWRSTIATAAGNAAHAAKWSPVGAFRASLTFYFPRPQTHYGSGKNAGKLKASAPAFHVSTPDADKLIRACLDAGTGILWTDDRLVCDIEACRRYVDQDETPGVAVRVERLEQDKESA